MHDDGEKAADKAILFQFSKKDIISKQFKVNNIIHSVL